jgi:hypothetical protein
VFKHNYYDTFGEPVPEFKHSRNVPLICFIVDSQSRLTHIALGKRGNMAGTDMRRLNLHDIFSLKNTILVDQVHDQTPNRLKGKIQEKLTNGGLLPPKSFEFLIQIISSLAPETAPILSKYSEARIKRIENLPQNIKETLAEQKEAVATAMSIAGIDREELQGWDVNEDGKISSFLSGLEKVRLREDPMIINDLTNLTGYKVLKTTPFNSVVFENDQAKLTVVLANRLPLEKQLGVDLIYYNETFSCFLMIQYKTMEKEGDDAIFRFPNKQLTEEVDRMNAVLAQLQKIPPDTVADGFRLTENPFFLKICPRIIFNPDNIGLVKGMYLPLGYWELLSQHPTMVGPKGGKRLLYKNVRRYFDNTDFITIASGGWVGTNIEQSKLLENAIKSTLESGRALVFAVNIEKDSRHRQSG